jgi:hypothetical protein
MQIYLIPALLLFLGSYFPLSLILLLQDITPDSWNLPLCYSINVFTECQLPQLANPGRVGTFFVICFLSLIFFLWCLKHFQGLHDIQIEESRTIPNDLINYVFPYVVSFMGLEVGATGKFYGFIVFLVLMFLITYRSGQILMNPLLLVAGWQLYEIRGDIEGHKRNLCALSKGRVSPGDRLRSCTVQGIYVLSREEKDK